MKREHILKIRLSSDEKETLKKKAHACALPLSSYTRLVLIRSTPKTAMTEEERKLYRAAYELWVWLKKYEILLKNATKGMSDSQRFAYIKSVGMTEATAVVITKIYDKFSSTM